MTDETEARVAALGSKTWAELEALEFQDRLLFPGELRRRRKDGSLEAVPVMLRVPRQHELRRARVAARQLALSMRPPLDLDRDKDLVDALESLVVLQEAIRNTTAPHEPYVGDPVELEKRWDKESLAEAQRRVDALALMIDPAPNDMTQEQTFELLAKIAEVKNISPLAAYGPSAQSHFVVSMVNMLLAFLASRSSSESSGSSTPA